MPLGATSDVEPVAPTRFGSTKKRPRQILILQEGVARTSSHHAPHRAPRPRTRDVRGRAGEAPRRSGAADVALNVGQLHAQALRYAEDPVVAIELAVHDAANAGVRDLLEAVPARA